MVRDRPPADRGTFLAVITGTIGIGVLGVVTAALIWFTHHG